MAKILLNDKSARRPAPESGQVELWDKSLPGFGLRVAAGGSRTYFVMKRVRGKLVRRTVGRHPPLDVMKDAPLGEGEYWPAEARARGAEMLTAMARGLDPAPRTATFKAAVNPNTFGAVAAAYFKDPAKRGGAALKSRGELERKVRVDLANWKDQPLSEITRAEVRAIIAAKHVTSPVSANRLLALIRRIFRWAVREDLVAANPAVDIDPPAQEEERDRVLSLSELARIWAGAEALGYPYGPLIQTLILTAQRRSEVAELPRSELDGSSWKLPDGRVKRGKGHLVPLSPRAKLILDALPRVGGGESLVFTTGKRAAAKGQKVDRKAPPAPVSGWSRMKTRLDKIIAQAAAEAENLEQSEDRHFLLPWTLHDLRRSVATHLRDEAVMGVAVDRLTVSKILNHAEGGVTRIYDRYSNDPEKRRALDAWATVVERTCGLNVESLNGRVI